MLLLGMGTGVVVGYAAVFLIALIELIQVGFFGEDGKLFVALRHVSWYRIFLVSSLGGWGRAS